MTGFLDSQPLETAKSSTALNTTLTIDLIDFGANGRAVPMLVSRGASPDTSPATHRWMDAVPIRPNGTVFHRGITHTRSSRRYRHSVDCLMPPRNPDAHNAATSPNERSASLGFTYRSERMSSSKPARNSSAFR